MKTATAQSVPDMIDFQQQAVRTGQYEFIGKAWVVVLEASQGAAVPRQGVVSRLGTRLEFFGGGIPLAQTLDHSSLLLLAPVRLGEKFDGPVGLPDIPDPEWVPPVPKPSEIENLPPGKYYEPPRPPMIPQRLEDRARGRMKNTNYLVFGPVSQVLIRPEGLAEGWIAECTADPATGTQMDLLIDTVTGRAHFYGGRYVISRIG